MPDNKLELLKAKAKAKQLQAKQIQKPSLIQQAKTVATKGFPVSPGVQKAAQILETPIRAARAGAIGYGETIQDAEARSLLLPMTAQTLQQQAANIPAAREAFREALQIDFEAQGTRQEILGAAGEIAGISLMTMPILATTTKHPGVAGALTFGALKTIQQASREGRIVPVDVAQEAAIAGVLPAIKPATAAVSRAMRSTLRGLFKQTARIDTAAFDALIDNPKLMTQFKGLREGITEKSLNIQKSIVRAHNKVGNLLGRYKDKLGISTKLTEPITDVKAPKPEDLDDAFNVLMDAVKTKSIPDNRLIAQLVELRSNIYNLTTFKPGQTLPALSDKVTAQLKNRAARINEVIAGLKGGKRLRTLEQSYAKLTEVYERLQQKLSTPGKVEEFFGRVMRREAEMDEILGTPGEIMNLLRKVEKRTGEKIIQPMIDELASRQFQSITPHGFSGSILAGMAALLAFPQHPGLAGTAIAVSSPKVVSKLVPAAQKLGEGLKTIGKVISRADARALISAISLLQGGITDDSR
jgi:hypothetical protein